MPLPPRRRRTDHGPPRLLADRSVHFFAGLPVGLSLVLLGGAVVLDASPQVDLELAQGTVQLVTLAQVPRELMGLACVGGGLGLLADCARLLRTRGLRLVAWTVAGVLLFQVTLLATLATIVAPRPLGLWAFAASLLVSYTLVYFVGPPLAARDGR